MSLSLPLSFSLSLLLFLTSLLLLTTTTTTSTTISSFSISLSPWLPSQNQTLLSPDSTFAAGFYPLPTTSPTLFTFSIWYYHHNTTTLIWSANQKSPVAASATLKVTPTGDLRLAGNSSGPNLWPSSSPASNSNSTQLTLSDAGELVFGEWSSFDFPTDTVVATQNTNGTAVSLRNGNFEFVNWTHLVFNGSDRSYWRTLLTSDFGAKRSRRLTLDDDGNLRIYSYDPDLGQWEIVWEAVQELCTIHGTCGPNSICITDGVNKPTCDCPPGFRTIPGTTAKGGCERKVLWTPSTTKFLRLDFVNFSGGSNQTELNCNFTVCQGRCLSDPKCLGFGIKYDGSGYCVLQLERLLNGYWSPGTETAMFLRVDTSEPEDSSFTGMTSVMETTCPVGISLPLPPKESHTTTRNIVIVCTLFAAELVSGVLFFWAFVKKYIKYRDMARTLGLEFLPAGGPKRFSYAELKDATKNFSNIIGRGAFGDVYKGELSDHRVVAVKCLKNVTGGDADFWAEVTTIARMHHLNLVRLWGFCAEKGQRILVHEYVPNGSLDKVLFPHARERIKNTGSEEEMQAIGDFGDKPILDWNIRYRIALGVARAIAYLHEECLEWVLHCDIKPENILLGDDFCPKISDFGLAKLKKKEAMVSKSKMRGTRGYMAPEWLKMDPITPKADVYSFGMVLLEIVGGVRNHEIQGSKLDSDDWYFPRWAFEKVFKEMRVEDILDRHIKQCYDSRVHFHMVDRMVKTAMWCLQDRVEMRPSMGKVAKMLEGTVEIDEPKKPTIYYLGDE
ncbi:hypothetical protein RHGRI_026588 [Rhododendron griersonianum]|uniref:Receptor-like serine/threonine-protein kinase n=1 Tax=Rhododendron griersonianum TaxID=479676 RepID=A0AAV6IX63_9ERIC|nr:hypothetical protein RHGRI_026588 [Rhododendron griersonianum]